jgi:hypothetical protein
MNAPAPALSLSKGFGSTFFAGKGGKYEQGTRLSHGYLA